MQKSDSLKVLKLSYCTQKMKRINNNNTHRAIDLSTQSSPTTLCSVTLLKLVVPSIEINVKYYYGT